MSDSWMMPYIPAFHGPFNPNIGGGGLANAYASQAQTQNYFGNQNRVMGAANQMASQATAGLTQDPARYAAIGAAYGRAVGPAAAPGTYSPGSGLSSFSGTPLSGGMRAVPGGGGAAPAPAAPPSSVFDTGTAPVPYAPGGGGLRGGAPFQSAPAQGSWNTPDPSQGLTHPAYSGFGMRNMITQALLNQGGTGAAQPSGGGSYFPAPQAPTGGLPDTSVFGRFRASQPSPAASFSPPAPALTPPAAASADALRAYGLRMGQSTPNSYIQNNFGAMQAPEWSPGNIVLGDRLRARGH